MSAKIVWSCTLSALSFIVFASCNKAVKPQQPFSHELSSEQRVQQLQRDLGSPPPLDSQQQQSEAARSVEEITCLGLSQRAWQEFTARIPGASDAVEHWLLHRQKHRLVRLPPLNYQFRSEAHQKGSSIPQS